MVGMDARGHMDFDANGDVGAHGDVHVDVPGFVLDGCECLLHPLVRGARAYVPPPGGGTHHRNPSGI